MRRTALVAVAFVLLSLASPAIADEVATCVAGRDFGDASPAVQWGWCTCMVNKFRKALSPSDFGVWARYQEILAERKGVFEVGDAMRAYFAEHHISVSESDAAIKRVLGAMDQMKSEECMPK